MRTATVHAIQKWEYEEITTKTEVFLRKELNDLGQLGWELVTIIQHKDRKGEPAWSAFVKRPYVPHSAEPPRPKPVEEQTDTGGQAPQQGFDLSGEEFEIKE